MSNLSVFEFEGFKIRWVDDQPVANDVAAALGYADPASTINRRVKSKYKGVAEMTTPSGIQSVTVLKEPGIYQLVVGSKLESAERFQDWLFEEVLPSIRKTGSYSTAKPLTQSQMLLQAAQQLVEIEQRQLEQEQQQRQLQAVTVDHDHRLTAVEAEVGRYHDPTGHYYSVLGYASLNKVKLAHGDALRFGKAAAKVCVQRGITIGKIRDHRYGEVNSYPVEVLNEVFGLVKA